MTGVTYLGCSFCIKSYIGCVVMKRATQVTLMLVDLSNILTVVVTATDTGDKPVQNTHRDTHATHAIHIHPLHTHACTHVHTYCTHTHYMYTRTYKHYTNTLTHTCTPEYN